MKTFFEILEEAAVEAGDISLSSAIKLNLDDEHLELLTKAADIYASQSNSHKPVVGGPGSDVRSEGEQLGNEGSAKSVSVGICKQDYIHWSEDILKCRCCGHKKRA